MAGSRKVGAGETADGAALTRRRLTLLLCRCAEVLRLARAASPAHSEGSHQRNIG